MEKNQVENQVDYQDDLILNNNFAENDENIVCNIYKEQFDLINELPLEERLKVLYIAILKAFYDTDKKNQKNQVENQVDYTYIYNSNSIYNSIYNSLNNYSKTLLKLLFKTINCKNYKNWGGKRKNSGRKKIKIQNNDDIQCFGEYKNVVLIKGDYEKLTTAYQSKEIVNEAIENLGVSIREGKENPYNEECPYAHYERLRKYINYRKTHPQQLKGNATDRKVQAIMSCFGGSYG